MHPSPDQEPGENPPPAYSYTDISPYSVQEPSEKPPSAYASTGTSPYAPLEPSENPPLAYSYTGTPLHSPQESSKKSTYVKAQPNPYNSPAQAASSAYPPLTSEHHRLIVDLLAYPWRSVRLLCQPGERNFAREKQNARWAMVWISIFALPLLSSLIALLPGMTSHPITSSMSGNILLGPLVVLPILFFIVQGMIWPLARHYQGVGTFLEQCYTTSLPLAPFFLLGSIISISLVTNSAPHIVAILILIEFLLFLYSSILLVISLKAVHALTTWEAFTLALLPIFSMLAALVLVLAVALR